MSGHDWVSAHVFYHGDLDVLVGELISPLTKELTRRRLARQFFFLRYWDGGPHIRLRVRPARGRSGIEVRELVERRCEEYLRRRPAPDRLDEQEYARVAAQMAQFEATTPLPRMYPNNSVVFIPYVREGHRFGDGKSILAIERHFGESSQIALEMLAARPTPDQRATLAFCLILLTWFLCVPSAAELRAYLGLSSAGARTLLPGWDEHAAGEMEERYRRQCERLQAIADRMRAATTVLHLLPHKGTNTLWARSVTQARDVVTDEIALGRFVSRRPNRAAAVDTQAAVLRVLDQCAHLMCNRIGLSIGSESALRYLAGRTVHDLTKES
ncbi:lantibiotic dehydratase C-terminal domain-containing protein [Kutzneria sp. 744]|uniref:lantibiotic dehydratase C-terminal domain-containing protein n=1 Tax=Kutzneria sp. (strain 744) TaxID=345341 RepID=UPI0003EECFEA|nr:lantibiotic dehydratase C-terminal domain-containing protein [Kutzneria sp. 744]EWM13652.1 LigA protein [Kutzneria sp. 744]